MLDAEVLWAAGDRKRAVEQARHSHDGFAALGADHADQAREAEDWLDKHAPRSDYMKARPHAPATTPSVASPISLTDGARPPRHVADGETEREPGGGAEQVREHVAAFARAEHREQRDAAGDRRPRRTAAARATGERQPAEDADRAEHRRRETDRAVLDAVAPRVDRVAERAGEHDERRAEADAGRRITMVTTIRRSRCSTARGSNRRAA